MDEQSITLAVAVQESVERKVEVELIACRWCFRLADMVQVKEEGWIELGEGWECRECHIPWEEESDVS